MKLAVLCASSVAAAAHSPWPRMVVDAATWSAAAEQLAAGALNLVALWGEHQTIQMALADADELSRITVMSLACPDGLYPSVGRLHPPATRLERAAADLYGLIPDGLHDRRPWLQHDLGKSYAFLPVDAPGHHVIPVGPVHAGIIEPGFFRFSADGETVIRLEQRLGYAHKGVQRLFRGGSVPAGARLAGRCSGDSTVAYALAYAQAAEAALGWEPPARAVWLRALMAELERVANHFGDIGAICNDAGFAVLLAHCAALREDVLREAARCFGHRLMMDCVTPGGVGMDLDPAGERRLGDFIESVRRRFKPLVALYDKTASLQDRTIGTGIVTHALAAQFGAGGYVGRAAGRRCDARRWPGYPPYPQLEFNVPVRDGGDVNARLWIRADEIEQSLQIMQQILARLPLGPIQTTQPARGGEGVALVEGFRGDIFATVRIGSDGGVEHCFLRDPSWFQWPLLEAAIEGNIVADFPLCNKSFNCAYSGVDL